MNKIIKDTVLILTLIIINYIINFYTREIVYEYHYSIKIISRIFWIIILIWVYYHIIYNDWINGKYKSIFYIASFLLFYLSISYVNRQINIWQPELEPFRHYLFLFSCISVGVFEELLFRVIIFNIFLNYFLNKQLVRSVILTSFLFGFAHLTNFLNPDFEPFSVLIQIFFAFSIGLIFQCIYVKTKSLVFISALHALVNYLGMYKSRLLNIKLSDNTVYSFNDFFISLATITIITIIVMLPICWLLIKKHR